MTPCRLGQAHPLLGRPALRVFSGDAAKAGALYLGINDARETVTERARAVRGEDRRGVVTPGNTHLKERTVYAQSITVLSEDAPSLARTLTTF